MSQVIIPWQWRTQDSIKRLRVSVLFHMRMETPPLCQPLLSITVESARARMLSRWMKPWLKCLPQVCPERSQIRPSFSLLAVSRKLGNGPSMEITHTVWLWRQKSPCYGTPKRQSIAPWLSLPRTIPGWISFSHCLAICLHFNPVTHFTSILTEFMFWWVPKWIVPSSFSKFANFRVQGLRQRQLQLDFGRRRCQGYSRKL